MRNAQRNATAAPPVAPQTASAVQLQRLMDTHPARGLTPEGLARILLQAEQGDIAAQCDLFTDMQERDGHIFADMSKRKRAALKLDWELVPRKPGDAQRTAQVTELIKRVPAFKTLLMDLNDGIGKGFSCVELDWRRTDVWLPFTATYRPQSWFKPYRGYREEIHLNLTGNPDGVPLTPMGWIVHKSAANSGYLARSALFRVLVWPYILKNYSVAFLAEFLEVYGHPLKIARTPDGYADKEGLLLALRTLGRRACGVIPQGVMLDLHDAVEGSEAPFQAMIDWCERTTSKVILGATLGSQSDRSSNTNALGNIHAEAQDDIEDGDAEQLAETLTAQLVYPIAFLNGLCTSLEDCPRFVFDTRRAEDLVQYADAIPKLVGVGMPVEIEWLQQKLRWPAPREGKAVLALPRPGPAGIAAASGAADDSDIVDRWTGLVAKRQPMAAMVAQIKEIVDNADSLGAVREGLLAAFGEMDTKAFGELMRLSLAAAAMSGRYDVSEGL